MKSNHLMDRRTCLKGIGASLALPLLDIMGWAESGKTMAVKPPVRLGFMYMPHGVIMEQFWPKSPESFLSSPPPALASLRPVLNQCLMMKGISGVPIAPFNGAPHALELSTWLTAALPDAKQRDVINIAISADQIAANFVGGFTALPSLELATMPQTHKENQEGLNEGYYSHCSFRSATQAVPAEINPRNVLNRLFGKSKKTGSSGKVDPLDRQMLDLVLGGAKDLRRKLPRDDQHKLDEYLDSVRSVERRIAAIEYRQKEAALEAAGVSVSKRLASDSPPIAIKIPEGDKRSEYMEVMCDLNVLAFQTDSTRIATLMFAHDGSNRTFPEVGVGDGHHSLSHHENKADRLEKIAKIDRFYAEHFAYLLGRLQGVKGADGRSLLDDSMVVYASGLSDGNRHKHDDLPVILAGRAGGRLETGRHLLLPGEQPMSNLFVTMLDLMGVEQNRFGDSTGPLRAVLS